MLDSVWAKIPAEPVASAHGCHWASPVAYCQTVTCHLVCQASNKDYKDHHLYIQVYIYIYIIWNPTFQFASKIFVSFRGLMSYGSCADFFCFPPLWKSWNSDTPNSNSGANLVQAKHLMPVQVTLDGLIAEHAESIVDFVNWFVQRCQL